MTKVLLHTFLGLSLISSFPLLSGFEAHVVNVTAKIEGTPRVCDARSKGYWANHEGCFQGVGESEWVNEVNELSATFSGVFATTSSSQICIDIWTPNCNVANKQEERICKAKTHLLADLLNVVSGRLYLQALLAGAFNNDPAFLHLGLTAYSTVEDALQVVEEILADPTSSKQQMNNAGMVAARIYKFYEHENPLKPRCVLDPNDVSLCPPCPECQPLIEVENNESGIITNIVSTSSDTSGTTESNATTTTVDTNIANVFSSVLGDITSNTESTSTITTSITTEEAQEKIENTVEVTTEENTE